MVKLLRREISRQKSSLLILDGLLNARSKAESPLDTKQFISELQGHAAFAGCTVLFLTSSQLDDGSPEHTMVDGVIEMGEESVASKAVRRIRLRKTRGSGAIAGPHEFEITENGITVYPRIESILTGPALIDTGEFDLLSSGIPTLDTRIGGGLMSSSVTLVMGPSGAGKTSLGAQFLAGSMPQAPGLYFGFHESPSRLRMKAQALGHDFTALEQSGALHLSWNSASAGLIDRLAYDLLYTVKEKGDQARLYRQLAGHGQGLGRSDPGVGGFTAVLGELRSRDVTVLATWEIQHLFSDHPIISAPELSGVMDNLLLIQFGYKGSELQRQLSILKIRDNAYDPSLLEVVIGHAGIELKKA